MPIQSRPEITIIELIAPLVVALIFITLCSLFREQNRRNFSALSIAGAGAAYLNGGLLGWEFAFYNVMTGVAYFGLKDYRSS
jgi:chromate transport protein ChrA